MKPLLITLITLFNLLGCLRPSSAETTTQSAPNVARLALDPALSVLEYQSEMEAAADGFFSSSGHTNNWAVLICTSRFWLNYRHIANTLSLYRTVKRLGIPDSQIILMLPDDVACNPRNRFRATVYNNARREVDLYGVHIEVDYRGYEVTVENIIRLLTGRLDPDSPQSKFLNTDDRSNILIYMTGHGGDDFIKIQDSEEISGEDLADAFQQMHVKGRYHEILYVVDTCQASTMYEPFYTPNILAVGSSLRNQNSYSHHPDPEIGVGVIDRFTYYNLEVLERLDKASTSSLQQLFEQYDPRLIASTPGIRSDLFSRNLSDTKITDFFGSVQNVYLVRRVEQLGHLCLEPPPIKEIELKHQGLGVHQSRAIIQGALPKPFRWTFEEQPKAINPLIYVVPMALYALAFLYGKCAFSR